jgi:hypothetical protein
MNGKVHIHVFATAADKAGMRHKWLKKCLIIAYMFNSEQKGAATNG